MAVAVDNYGMLQGLGYGVSGVASLAGAYAQSEALRAQGSFQRTMSQINYRFAEIQASDALRAGDRAANQIRASAKKTVGAQRAAAAAQGIDVAAGTITDQLYDTETQSEADALNVRNNAWREAWGIKTQATLNLNEASLKSSAAEFAANQTLVTGGLSAMGSFAQSGYYGLKAYGSTGPSTTTTQTPTQTKTAASDDAGSFFGTASRDEQYSVSGKDPRWWPANKQEEDDAGFMGAWAKSARAKQRGSYGLGV